MQSLPHNTLHHRRNNRLAFYLTVAVLLAASFLTLYQAEAWLSGARSVPTGGGNEVFFQTSYVDTTGRVHVVWMSTDGSARTGSARYARGRLTSDRTGIIWDPVQQISTVNMHRSNPPAIVVTSNGTVLVGYGGTDSNYHLLINSQRGTRGAWRDEIVADMRGDGNSENFGVSMNVSADGRVFMAWGSGLGGNEAHLMLTYRRGPNNWAPPQRVSGSEYLVRSTRLAVAGTGNATTVHVVYEFKDNERQSGFSTGYTRWRLVNRSFANTNLSGLFGHSWGTDPAIAVDQRTGRLFASYVSRVTGSSNEFTLRLTQSTNGGATWAPPGSTRIDRRTWPGPAWIAAINNVAHMAVEQRTSSGSNKRVYHQSFNANTNRYSAFTRVSNNEQSLMPSISIGGGIRFTTFNVGRLLDSVKYNLERANDAPPVTPTRTRTPTPRLPTATPTPPAPNGALVVQGDLGVGRTSSQNVTVSLANVTGSPNEYQLRNDIPNFAPPYSPLTAANIPWVLNNPVGTGCELRSVYGILRNSGNGLSSAALQGRVLFDPAVSVNVEIRNPFLAGNPTTNLQDFGGGGGASNGDPIYTRSVFYYGRVTAKADECSGLREVRFGTVGAGRVTTTSADGTFPLPEFELTDGPQTVQVEVVDGANHSATFTGTIVLDRSQPQITNLASAALAAVDRDGNAITQADSILVNLYFSDLLVTDRTYGEREDQPFWGVWLANSTQQFVISDTTQLAELNALDWRPVQVANAARSTADNSYTFTVPNWSLFTGVPNAQVGRDYYVYARVIDGAGNASVQTLVTQRIPVSADAVGPSLFLPRLTR